MVKRNSRIEMKVTETSADLFIYGDITSDADFWNWMWETNSYVSSNNLVKTIQELQVDDINVYINSYGGEVAEALAIYSALKRHTARVHTYCDGFACSAATIIFCAGDDRIMGDISLMMIHNAAVCVGYATADKMRKAADDIDKITQRSVKAYLSVSNLSEDDIRDMMDKETWISADEALAWGFATKIAEQEPEEAENPAQHNAFLLIRSALLRKEPEDPESDPILNEIRAFREEITSLISQKEDPEPEPEPEPEPKKANERIGKYFSFLK